MLLSLACSPDTYAPALEKLQYQDTELQDSTILESSFFLVAPWLGAEPDAGHSVPKHRGAKLRITLRYAPEEVSLECMRIEVTINVLLV